MSEACANCDAPLTGRYCAACGQKRIEPDERRISWFVRQFVEAVTMVDERFVGSIRRLLFSPGALERDWFDGRRRRHLAPLTLFLIANLVYFVAPPLSDFNLTLAEQLGQPWGEAARALVDARLAARGVTFADYAAVYGARADDLAKLMIILQVPVLALMLAAVHYRRRLYYVDHLAVSLNFHAFLLVALLVVPPALATTFRIVGGAPWMWKVALLAIVLGYAWRQLTVAYGQRAWLAAAKLPLFFAGLAAAHAAHRALQFCLAFALT